MQKDYVFKHKTISWKGQSFVVSNVTKRAFCETIAGGSFFAIIATQWCPRSVWEPLILLGFTIVSEDWPAGEKQLLLMGISKAFFILWDNTFYCPFGTMEDCCWTPIGFYVPENPYFTRVFGFLYFCGIAFATLLQHVKNKSFLQQMKLYKVAYRLIAHLK